MSSKTRTLAIVLSAVLVLSVLGSGAALAASGNANDYDEDPVEDYSTENETVDDGNETDSGNETVDENETSDDNETVDENETDDGDETAHEPFGDRVTAFVHGLVAGSSGDTNDTNTTNDSDVMSVTNDPNMTLGQQIAAFVVANNPGNAPDHAGPGNETGQPDHAGADNQTGKPAHAGGNESGQPDHAGPDGDKGPSTDDDDERGGGPPEDRGKSGE